MDFLTWFLGLPDLILLGLMAVAMAVLQFVFIWLLSRYATQERPIDPPAEVIGRRKGE